MEGFENLSQDDLDQLMQLGIIDPQMTSMDKQMEIAQKLRDRKPPQGTDTGRVYVAASPLEHLSYALNGIKAGRDIDKLRTEQQKLLAEQVRGRSKYFSKLNDPLQPVEPSVRKIDRVDY